ncbi:MAG: polysaccharide deacetylase family protein [Bacteroidota bacterium]|nr:polysaccharide deacetylase family protein [Ferruginibacter sp.]
MIRELVYDLRQFFANKAVVLMYHRIAEPTSDVWEIAVSPKNFEDHLKVIKQMGNVVSLEELTHRIKRKTLQRNTIGVSFDDGYPDNKEIALPLLEKYKVPATFFIASGNIDAPREFWWDELEQIILFNEQLPRNIVMQIGETRVETNLGDEMILSATNRRKHINWKACTETPPTGRAIFFYRVWELLKPMPPHIQQAHLQQLRTLAKTEALSRPGYRTMSTQELKEFAASALVTIGAHTVHHPALAFHSTAFQEKEIVPNRKQLQEITGKGVDLISYPYGNFSDETIRIVSDAGFSAAFRTEEETAQNSSNRYKLGRYQVKNLTGQQLASQIKLWKAKK